MLIFWGFSIEALCGFHRVGQHITAVDLLVVGATEFSLPAWGPYLKPIPHACRKSSMPKIEVALSMRLEFLVMGLEVRDTTVRSSLSLGQMDVVVSCPSNLSLSRRLGVFPLVKSCTAPMIVFSHASSTPYIGEQLMTHLTFLPPSFSESVSDKSSISVSPSSAGSLNSGAFSESSSRLPWQS